MNCTSFIPALVYPSGGGGGTIGPPGRDGKDGKDGKDGGVYVPHIDEHNVLTFTLEKDPSSPPPPVDLDPSDDWGPIEDDEIKTKYVWEPL